MKTYIEILDIKIKDNKCHSLDPFEVFERMKKSAIEAHKEFDNQFSESKNAEYQNQLKADRNRPKI